MSEAVPVAALTRLYGRQGAEETLRRLSAIMPERPFEAAPLDPQPSIWLLAYPKHVRDERIPGLRSLHTVVQNCHGVFDHVHVLPPFRSAADFGFAPIDHFELEADAGAWTDLRALSRAVRLSIDIVLNHVAPTHAWARTALRSEDENTFDPFIETDPGLDFSALARSRHHPPVTAFATPRGVRHYWTRYGPEQMDLDYRQPRVLVAMSAIIIEYARRGIRGLRLDALAFLWKDPERASANEPQVFEILTVLRWVADRCGISDLIAEGDVRRGLSDYVTPDRRRATIAYRYETAPIVLSTLLRGDNETFVSWLRTQQDVLHQTPGLNFLSTHDGVYLRPTDSPLGAGDLDLLVRTTEERGGTVVRRESGGTSRPYELDISVVDLLGGDSGATHRLIAGVTLVCWLPGVPMIYLGNLLCIGNDEALVVETGDERARNRGSIPLSVALTSLKSGGAARVLDALGDFRRLARAHDAFAAGAHAALGPDFGANVVSIVCTGETSRVLCMLSLGRRVPLRLPDDWASEGERDIVLEAWAALTIPIRRDRA